MADHDHTSYDRKIVAEQTRLIYGLFPMVAVGAALVAIGFAYAMWDHADKTAIIYWLIFMMVIAVTRVLIVTMFRRRNPGEEEIHIWMWLNTILLLVSGSAWGIGSVVLFPEDSAHHQAIVYFCLSGLTAGCLGAFSVRKEAVWAFASPALLFPIIFLLTKDGDHFTLMGFIMALYLFALFYSSIHFHNVYEKFFITSEALKAEITGRKKAESRLRILNNAIEQSREVVVITDHKGLVEYANPAFKGTTGYSVEEAIGENPRILNSGVHDEEFFRDLWNTITAGHNWSGVMTNKKKSGELYNEEMTISPVKNNLGEIEHFVAIKRDISERIRAEKELKESKERAEKATKLKDEFVSIVSHDLKNPVASISGLLTVLRKEIDIAPESQAEKIFRAISESCDNFFDMIEKLLNVSRFHTGDISIYLTRVNVKKACQIAIGQVTHLAKEKV